MRIAINGFGRIGRTILRQILSGPQRGDIDVVLINDIQPVETCAYLFKYDSTFGPFPLPVEGVAGALVVGKTRIPFSRSNDISTLDLSNVDVVLECSGHVPNRDVAMRGLVAGARRVLVSGPSAHADVTVVMGANDAALGDAKIVSNASCTTNAIAPFLREIDQMFGLVRAHITTIHCVTGSQPMVDSPRDTLERSRAGGESMVPTSTSAAGELHKVLPEIAARASVSAVRVPCLSVSAIDAVLQLETPVAGDGRAALRAIAERSAVIGVVSDPCVSRDLRTRPESLVIALPETHVVQDTQLRVFGWYDNEWGFSARMIDMARRLAAEAV